MERKTLTAMVLGAVAALVLLGLGGLAFVFSGAYEIAATAEHTGPVRWVLETTQERAVRVSAEEVPEPPILDAATLEHGFEHFHAMCVECHGAPGIERGEFGQGLNPRAPELSDEAAEWSDRELFWMVKNGIKFTGMPAFGPTHSDEEIWGIVAFLRRLQAMGPAEYTGLVARADSARRAAGQPADDGGHSHAPGTPAHSH